MSVCWFTQKLTELLSYEYNIRPSCVEIYQSSNQSSIRRDISESGDVSLSSLMDGSEGVAIGFEPSKLESCNKSRQYFLSHREMQLLECATSRPIKYFNVPRSL